MFSLEITLEQKRWGYLPGSDAPVEFHTRTEVTDLTIEDETGLQGSVGVQKEMMYSAFPAGLVLNFKDGLLQELYRGSIRPYTMYKTVDMNSYATATFEAVNNTEEPDESVGDVFTRECSISLSNFTASGFDWEAVIVPNDGSSSIIINGTGEYEKSFIVAADGESTGITMVMSTPISYAEVPDTTVYFMPASKILINGVWMPQSFEDELPTHGFYVSFVGTDVVFEFIGGYTLTIPQSNFTAGAWYELPDPTDPEPDITLKAKSGISVKFGFVEGEEVNFSQEPDTVFYGQLLSGEDTITAFEDNFIFRRPIDITDLRGSLGRYTDLSAFYRARRWVKDGMGVPRLYYLEETDVPGVYAWQLFTGEILTSNEPDLRASVAKTTYSDVERADEEALALVSMIRIFKSQYTDFVNTSFSTDTDEYPDKKQVIVI